MKKIIIPSAFFLILICGCEQTTTNNPENTNLDTNKTTEQKINTDKENQIKIIIDNESQKLTLNKEDTISIIGLNVPYAALYPAVEGGKLGKCNGKFVIKPTTLKSDSIILYIAYIKDGERVDVTHIPIPFSK